MPQQDIPFFISEKLIHKFKVDNIQKHQRIVTLLFQKGHGFFYKPGLIIETGKRVIIGEPAHFIPVIADKHINIGKQNDKQ